MKILYHTLSPHNIHSQLNYNERADYQSDEAFIGLRQLFGADCVDFPKCEHLYKGYEHSSRLWGKGFSYSQTLDNIDVDRDDLDSKIRNNYFDLIVIGLHHTAVKSTRFVESVVGDIRDVFKNKIAIVEGHDDLPPVWECLRYTPYYFRREMQRNEWINKLFPINFAIPSCKIVDKIPAKCKWVADIIPADHNHPNRKTHSYENEEDYYQDYRDSYFGLTTSKGGFACQRHIEILANGCMPLFGDLELCPEYTLNNFPKETLLFVKDWSFINLPKKVFTKNDILLRWNYVDESKFDLDLYNHTAEFLLKFTRDYLTTEALAKYLLEVVKL